MKIAKQINNDDNHKEYDTGNDNNSLGIRGNIFKKINIINMSKRRKNSIDTNASSTSYTSSNYSFIEKNEKGDNEIKKEDQNIMDYSTNLQT